MYSAIAPFLEAQYPAICAILDQCAAAVGGHYAQMTPPARRQNAEHDAVELIEALAQGQLNREAIRATGARPVDGGLIADDLLRLVALVEPQMRTLIQRELASQPDLQRELLARLHWVTTRYRTGLTSAKIDQVLAQFGQPPPRHSTPPAPGPPGK